MTSPSDDERASAPASSKTIRPWGKFRVYPHEKAGSLKIITVNPGGIAVSAVPPPAGGILGRALDEGLEVTIGERSGGRRPNEEIYIPREAPTAFAAAGPDPPGSWRSGWEIPTRRTSSASDDYGRNT